MKVFFKILYSKAVVVSTEQFSGPADLEHMHPAVLLYQMGYLTFDKVQESSEVYKLCFPNKELLSSIATLCRNMIFCKPYAQELKLIKLDNLQSAEEIINFFNNLFNALDYENNPFDYEGQVTNLLFVFFYARDNYEPEVSEHSAGGRADLIIRTPQRAVTVEIKLARDLDPEQGRKVSPLKVNYDKLLNEAKTRLQDRQYSKTLNSPAQRFFLAAVFSQYERKFVRFGECKV